MAVFFGPAGDVLQQLALTFVALAWVIGVMPIPTDLKTPFAEVFTVGAKGVEQLLGGAVDGVTQLLQLGISSLN